MVSPAADSSDITQRFAPIKTQRIDPPSSREPRAQNRRFQSYPWE
jgi:hypothetical protein